MGVFRADQPWSTHVQSASFVNKLFSQHVLRLLKPIHTEPKNPELLLEVALQAIMNGNAAFLRERLIDVAILKRDPGTVKLLLDWGADANNPDWEGYIPILAALHKNYPEIAKLLLPYTNREHIYKALDNAAECAISEFTQVILDSDSIDLTENEKISLFFSCCESGDRVGVQKFLDLGIPAATYNTEILSDVHHGLQATIQSGIVELVSLLLENGADVLVNSPSEIWIPDFVIRAETPLGFAASKGNPEVVRLLLENGADINAPGIHGTALQVAANKPGSDDLVKLLLEYGADVHAEAGRYGKAPDAAPRNPQRNQKVIQMLLDAGA